MRHLPLCFHLGVVVCIGCGGPPHAPLDQPAAPAPRTVEAPRANPDSSGAEKPDSRAIDSANEPTRLGRLSFQVPDGWQRLAPSSGFVMAEFTLPRAEGDTADGRLTVSAAGGSIDENIERWRGQFGGNPEHASQDRLDVNGMQVVIVDLGGTFDGQIGPGGPGFRMLAAIIPVGSDVTRDEFYFVKAVGPQATITAHADRFRQFVGSATKR
jgi:hypothetical protein